MTSVNDFDTVAHRLLNELERRHEQLLDELDSLNQRVDAVLSQYTQVQPDVQPAVLVADDALESDDE